MMNLITATAGMTALGNVYRRLTEEQGAVPAEQVLTNMMDSGAIGAVEFSRSKNIMTTRARMYLLHTSDGEDVSAEVVDVEYFKGVMNDWAGNLAIRGTNANGTSRTVVVTFAAGKAWAMDHDRESQDSIILFSRNLVSALDEARQSGLDYAEDMEEY